MTLSIFIDTHLFILNCYFNFYTHIITKFFIPYFMEKEWILVYDSGNGGKWTLDCLKKELPNENFLFFMDKTHCPYGNKSVSKLKKIVTTNIQKLRKIYNIKLVVIACNTISSMMSSYLKQTFYDLPFVFVFPYITKEILKKPTLILATKNTIKYNTEIARVSKLKNVFVAGFPTLAKKIDDADGNYDMLQPYLDKKLFKFRRKKLDNVVLGCTHFNYIKTQLQSALKAKVDFFENSQNVARHTKTMLLVFNLAIKKNTLGEMLFVYKV